MPNVPVMVSETVSLHCPISLDRSKAVVNFDGHRSLLQLLHNGKPMCYRIDGLADSKA